MFKFVNYKIDKDCNDCNECAIDKHDVESSTRFHHTSSSWSCDATTSTVNDNAHDNDDDDYHNERDADYEHCHYDDACCEFHKNNDDDDRIAALLHVIV